MLDIAENALVDIDRCVLSDIMYDDIIKIELYSFSDASTISYGNAIYLRVATNHVTIIRLLAAKSKLAPLKKETTPRIELRAAVVLVQLINSIKNAIRNSFSIEQWFCWSDSNVVLYWIHYEHKTQKRFIENRLTQIRNLAAKQHWGYCPSQNNPADTLSRGTSVSKLKESRLCRKSPTFLRSEKDGTVFQRAKKTPNFIDSDESTTVLVSANVHASDISALLPCENYCCFDRLIRITGLVLKFFRLLFRKISKETQKKLLCSALYDEATTLWYRGSRIDH